MSVTVNIPLDSLGIKWERLWEETGNGGYVPEGELLASYNDVIREIKKVCRPAFCYEIIECEGVCDGKLTVGGITLNPGKRIAGYLEKAEKIAVYVGTAGTGFEDYCRKLNKSPYRRQKNLLSVPSRRNNFTNYRRRNDSSYFLLLPNAGTALLLPKPEKNTSCITALSETQLKKPRTASPGRQASAAAFSATSNAHFFCFRITLF